VTGQVLEGYDTQLNEDEVLCLVQFWDKEQDGTINYNDFVDALRVADAALD
jgi:Ca2+-binding EF-hand superfamily protein